MRSVYGLALAIVGAGLALEPARAENGTAIALPAEEGRSASATDTGTPPEVMAAPGPFAAEISKALAVTPTTQTDRETEERAAVAGFYDARQGAPLWTTNDGLTPKGEALKAELAEAGEWGLDPVDFALPGAVGHSPASPETMADTETVLTFAAMKYARYARGGRIMHPAADLSSYLDRGPQLIEPAALLRDLASSADIAATLRAFHPHHPQFEKLRQVYLKIRGDSKSHKKGVKAVSADARRILANMEQWRWMPIDMGETYVWNNIPEFIQRVVHDGQVVRTEKIVAGELSKQTPIFSRPLKKIVFRPKWRVPESIKVREIWPSLLRGGGLMAQYGLQIETKDGQPVPFRSVNWATSDIRNYEVIQPPGGKSVLGVVKFSFPNQHTVYMHDTPDKYMFASSQRTYSHGCMRVKNPVQLAQVLLGYDKGWDAAAVEALTRTGPLDNEVLMDHKIPVHITYFTALVAQDGSVKTFRDVYGHERRITQALEGKWSEIVKGRDHLAPVEPDMAAAVRPRMAPSRTADAKPFDFMSSVFGGF